jgi:hypothetical protein
MSVNFDLKAFETELLEMAAQAPAIVSRSVNRAAVSGRAAMSRAITDDTGLAFKYSKRAIKLDKATRSHPTATLIIDAERIPLIAFGARGPRPSKGRGRGVSYGLKGSRNRNPNAFIAKVASSAQRLQGISHEGVMMRTAKMYHPRASLRKSRGARGLNLPIIELRGPSAAHVFKAKMDVFKAAAQESLVKNLAHEISFTKSKAGGE